MISRPSRLTAWLLLGALSGPAFAQTQASPEQATGARSFPGYIPAPARGGMATGGAIVPDSPLATGRELTDARIEGFNGSVEDVFPMTPEMIRRYRQIFEESQRATLEKPEPEAITDAGFLSLEPGEAPATLKVAPGIASVLGFYDATGQPWPILQFVVGNGKDFQVIPLGEKSNNLTLTPLAPLGWSNLVILLEGEPKPVVLRLEITAARAHYRHDIQIMRQGPNAVLNTAGDRAPVHEAGGTTLLAALAAVDLPSGARPVPIRGVEARGWLVEDSLILRSRHPLLSPSWTASMSGPDGVRVYQIAPGSVALFSVDGRIIRAEIDLP
jgi:intracellular multiplication protein IcmK